MGKIKLDSRLSAVADFVREGKTVADIGTDHAYLLAYLLQQGTIENGIAADLRKGPLENARKTLIESDQLEKVNLILSDGLDELKKGDCEDIVIAGMGGILIKEILERTPWVFDENIHIIAQPMTHAEVLRRFFLENGFKILEESSATDGKRFYCIISAQYDGIKRDAERVKTLMRSYARNQGAQISNAMLKADMQANDTGSLDEDTVMSYVNALKKIFVIEDMPAWNPNLRSKTAIRTSDTRYYIDSSIAVASLGLGPNDLIGDLETFGLLFETMCVRDLRVYADALGGSVYHYRDKTGLECDAVVHLRNGSYGLIEIKLGGDAAIEHGASTLKTLGNKINTEKMKSPSFLMVLTATGDYAYRREDGVYVVPVGCLRD